MAGYRTRVSLLAQFLPPGLFASHAISSDTDTRYHFGSDVRSYACQGGGPVTGSDLRLTPQRQAVLTALESATDHPTAADVFERVRIAVPGIGPATVYRTLALLVSHGLALELSLGDGSSARYDGNTSRHDHLVCSSCGAASDIDVALPAEVMHEMTSRTGYAISRYDLQFHGLCPDCQIAERSAHQSHHHQEKSHG